MKKFSYLSTMRECNMCKELLDETEFFKNNRCPGGIDRRCKKCQKEYSKKRRKKIKSYKTWYVYYLPEENYYGHTVNVKQRMTVHRAKGRNTDNYKVLKDSKNKSDILYLERLLQGKE